ncbi:TRAP transporter substrate-binding protein [Neobacillus niacini]|uniref:TRAP transporter substrate-binding protein n=1 Tax=Neobacillus niacini TaxID=86668 RepID=UPI0021CB6AA2|nr:TRAP transporter substrate-binding protein DctP [Neobacillus niacini]MCM3766169.1 TRAP transporter substrate-binding protein DctP [Neobacillus niacini]
MNRTIKLTFTVFTLVVMIFALAACGGNPSSGNETKGEEKGNSEQKSISLKFGSWTPETHHTQTNAFEPWAKLVGDETDGVVNIDVQGGSVLGGSQQSLQDVSGGVYDIGYTVAQYYPDTPLFKMTVLDLPFAFINAKDHYQKKVKVAERFVNEYVKEEFEKMGVKLLGVYSSDPLTIFSTTPIKSVKDLKGKRILLQGANWDPIIKGWGGTPVSVAIEDLYSALDRKTLDVSLYAPAGAYSTKIYEPAPYITNLPISGVSAVAIMNLDKYNDLSPDMQKRFDEEFSPKLMELWQGSFLKTMDQAINQLSKEVEGKGEIIQPNNEDIEGFMEPAKGVWKQWINEANKKGYDGQKLMDGFLRIMKEEGVEPPFTL